MNRKNLETLGAIDLKVDGRMQAPAAPPMNLSFCPSMKFVLYSNDAQMPYAGAAGAGGVGSTFVGTVDMSMMLVHVGCWYSTLHQSGIQKNTWNLEVVLLRGSRTPLRMNETLKKDGKSTGAKFSFVIVSPFPVLHTPVKHHEN